jgi:uncharacterized membrane protein YphA (DoxX/SURF4 family)
VTGSRRKRSFTLVRSNSYAHHGRAALHGTRSRKDPDLPHQPNHAPYAPFTLNTGLRGLLELVGGLLLALGLFTRPLPFVLAGDMGGRLFHGARAERCLPAAQRGELAIVHSFVSSISGSPGAANGALIEYASPHPHPTYRQARPEPSGAPATQRCRQFPRRCLAARSTLFERCQKLEKRPRSRAARIVVRGS